MDDKDAPEVATCSSPPTVSILQLVSNKSSIATSVLAVCLWPLQRVQLMDIAPQNNTLVFHDLLYWRYCEALYNEDCDNKTRDRIINLVTLHLSFQSSVLKNKKKCI